MDVIHIQDLEELSVKLDKTTNSIFWSEVIAEFRSQYKLAKYLGIGQYTISRWVNRKFLIPTDIILRLGKYSKLSLLELERSVILIGSAQGSLPIKIKLPLKITEDLAYLIGLIITDGHINKNLSWIQFASKEEELINLFRNKIIHVFNHERFYLEPKNPMVIYVKNKSISRLIWFLGIPKGKKSHIVSVPKYIFECGKPIIRSFLRGCFDGDGSVSYTPRRGLRIINYSTSSKQMSEDVSILLSRLNIKNSISKNIKNIYYINITGRINLENFKKEIGFNHPHRNIKLCFVINSYFRNPR